MWMPADLASGGKATAGKAASMLMVNGLKTAGKKAAAKTATKKIWQISRFDKVARHPKHGKLFRDPNTKLWWSKDTAKHGGSTWKVFEKEARGLRWIEDADEYGNYMNKHKGDIGKFIKWSELIF